MENIWLSLVLSSLLAGLALWKRAITKWGTLLAWCFSVVISYFCGWVGFAALASVFVFTLLAGRISGKKRQELEKKLHAKSGSRDAAQIFCNVAVAAFMAALWGLTKREELLCAFGGALAASLADSMASEMGILSKTPPRDICSLKPVRPGISGGVTALGLCCSALGAAIIGLVCLGFGKGVTFSVCIMLAGVFASLLDSVLGSALQAKYRCPVCGALTEKRTHCGAAGRLEKGLGFVNNDAVNFVNNLGGALAALCLWMIF